MNKLQIYTVVWKLSQTKQQKNGYKAVDVTVLLKIYLCSCDSVVLLMNLVSYFREIPPLHPDSPQLMAIAALTILFR